MTQAIPVAGEAAPAPVTRINAGLTPAWGKAESVEWDNEGRHVQGWLLYPANYDASKRYPMIVTVHGGPSSAVIPHWPGVGFGGVSEDFTLSSAAAVDRIVFEELTLNFNTSTVPVPATVVTTPPAIFRN